MRKMSLSTALTAPFFPLLLELAAVIRKNSLKKPLLLLQPSSTLWSNCSAQAYQPRPYSKRLLPARLFEQKFYGLFEHMSLAFESTSLQRQRSFHAQSIRRRLNSYNFDAGLDYGKTTGSIVCTIATEIVRTIIQPSPQDQLSGLFVEQKDYALFEQKNTIPSLLDSRN
jgi:hypothetical protein